MRALAIIGLLAAGAAHADERTLFPTDLNASARGDSDNEHIFIITPKHAARVWACFSLFAFDGALWARAEVTEILASLTRPTKARAVYRIVDNQELAILPIIALGHACGKDPSSATVRWNAEDPHDASVVEVDVDGDSIADLRLRLGHSGKSVCWEASRKQTAGWKRIYRFCR